MRQRSAFWHWRHARPFWGGLFVFLAGVEMFLTVWAPLAVVVHVGMQGFIGYLLPILLAVLGLLLLANPAQHLFYSLVAAVLSLASWLTSNLGGFIFGLLMGVIGSALAFAWSPDKYRVAMARTQPPPADQPPPPRQERLDTLLADNDEQPPDEQPQNEQPPDEQPSRAGQPQDTPGVQPDTSQSRPRHSRPSPGLLSGE
jgi:Family of unknown function (DUF6114)